MPHISGMNFKSNLLPSTLPVLVEFRSVSSEVSGRKKKKIEDRMAVKQVCRAA